MDTGGQLSDQRTQDVPEKGSLGGGLYYNFKGVQGKEDSWVSDWYNSSLKMGSGGHLSHNSSLGGHLLGSGGGHLYQAIIQGVLVCLFTTVGGVMLLVFCLIIVQECKVHKWFYGFIFKSYTAVDVCLGCEKKKRGCGAPLLS